MNRRVLIRNLSMAVAGAAIAGRLGWQDEPETMSYTVLTDDPDMVMACLRDAGCTPSAGFRRASRAIGPVRQDLAVVRAGRLIPPEDLRGWEGELSRTLRARQSQANTLVSVERMTDQPVETVEFRVDGDLVEQIRLDRSYRRVEIPGHQGLTVFRIDGGLVSVESSSCRRQLCQKCGSTASGRIVCAPNRLVATVSGGHVHVLDAISG